MNSKLEARVSEAVCGLRHRLPSTDPNAEHAYRCCDSRDCDYKTTSMKNNLMYCTYAPAEESRAYVPVETIVPAAKAIVLPVGGGLMSHYAPR